MCSIRPVYRFNIYAGPGMDGVKDEGTLSNKLSVITGNIPPPVNALSLSPWSMQV